MSSRDFASSDSEPPGPKSEHRRPMAAGLGRLLVAEGARLAGIGIAIGLPAGIALTRLLSGLLYEVSASDPLVLAGVPVLLALVAIIAALLPARRATRVDPMVALRQQ